MVRSSLRGSSTYVVAKFAARKRSMQFVYESPTMSSDSFTVGSGLSICIKPKSLWKYSAYRLANLFGFQEPSS